MSKADLLKQRVLSGSNKGSEVTTFFYMIKELGLFDELFGAEYEGEFTFKKELVPFSFKRKPMSLSTFNLLVKEFSEHIERENRANKKKR